MNLLEVDRLKKVFTSGLFSKTHFTALDGVSFLLKGGQTLGLLGSSGSGKSTLARTVIRLIEPTDGRIMFYGQDITRLPGRSLRPLAKKMQIIFQNPESSLNPRMRICDAIAEPLRIHRLCDADDEKEQINDLLDLVNLNREILYRYPFELSGGQLQRVVIARILALEPDCIIADEPTSMLDASVQAQILNLLQDLQEEKGISFLFISHDRDVVERMSDDIAVLEKGRILSWE
jgi:peptide/nickel transport system ATP-binding protein